MDFCNIVKAVMSPMWCAMLKRIDNDDIPTAYDVDKVVKSISEVGERYCNSVKCDKNCNDCDHGCLMRTITNIVKRGGIY